MLKKSVLTLGFIFAVILLMGGNCGGGGPRAKLGNVSDTSLALTTPAGTTATTSFTFENTGDTTLDYSIFENEGFLEITQGATGIVAPGDTATVALEATCISQGTLNGTVTVESNGGDTGIDVEVVCTAPAAQLGNLSDTSLSLTSQVGSSATDSFTFENIGQANLTYTASTSAAFLEVTQGASGTITPGDTATVVLNATCSAEGTFNGNVSIDSNGGDATVAITLTCNPASASEYDINSRFYGTALPSGAQTAAADAVSIWVSIIKNDLPDFNLDDFPGPYCVSSGEPDLSGQIVDDLLILVTADPDSDGVGGGLAAAGPGLIINSSNPEGSFTRVGCVFIDPADANNPQLTSIILHELGHVFGIGTLWETFSALGNPQLINFTPANGCDTGSFSTLPTYTAPEAKGEFGALGGTGNIPVEEAGGPGTRCSHWNEETFDNELMTGFLNGGEDNPLSRMTIASLEDLGYQVDRTKAEPYSLPSLLAPSTQKELHADWEVVLPPRVIVTIDGSVIRLNGR